MMRRIALGLAVALLAAGCGSKPAEAPRIALLTGVDAAPEQVVFEFQSAPREVRARYRPPSQIAESGSGAKVDVRGGAVLVVTFTPAATADLQGEDVVPTYTGPKRIRVDGSGPVLEVVKIGDFEAQLDWAIGVVRHRRYEISRDGDKVIVSFDG